MKSKVISAVVALVVIGGFFLYLFATDLPAPGGRSERGDEVVETISSFSRITSSTQIKTESGILRGVFVTSVSSADGLKFIDALKDNGSGSIIVDDFIPVKATMYDFGSGIAFSSGLHVVVSAEHFDGTIFYR